jgi:hypothetical protein
MQDKIHMQRKHETRLSPRQDGLTKWQRCITGPADCRGVGVPEFFSSDRAEADSHQ